MSSPPNPISSPRWEQHVYHLLLYAYPLAFRRQYGEGMTELFLSRQQRAQGRLRSRLQFWAHILKDLFATAPPERLETWNRKRTPKRQGYTPTPVEPKGKESLVDTLVQDLKHALRRSGRSPGFTAMALLIVGLGIGANTAMFSIVETILFRPQPWERPDELVWVYQDSDDGEPSSSSYPAYKDMASHTDVYSGVAALIPGRSARHLTPDGEAQEVTVSYVTSSLFPVLGLQPSRGRWFEPSVDVPGGEPVGVVSHRTWQRRFGSDPDILGRTVRISGGSVTVVGVGPKDYRGELPGVDTDFWLSISASGPVGGDYYWNTLEHREDHWFLVLARLKSGVTVEQSQGAMDILADRLAKEYPQLNKGRDITVFPSSKVRVHPEEDALLYPTAAVLMSVVGLVLLIACSNLANLLLARASTRGREVAVRQAMGATRGRLVRLLLTESVVLALVGGVVGLVFADWVGRALAAFPLPMEDSLSLEISFNWRVLLFALGLSVLTGIVFGLAPALRASRPDLVPSLKDSVDSVSLTGHPKRNFRWFGLRNVLVAVQVAVSFVLLVGAGLLIRSLINAETVDLGFRSEGLAILQADAAEGGYKGEVSVRLFQDLRERVSGLPGVEHVALTTRLPVSPRGGSSTLEVEGYEPPTGTGYVEVIFALVDSGYFKTLNIPLLHGRTFAETDRMGTERVAVVNEAFARNFWGISDAVGRRYRHQGYPDSWVRIVGVVGDAKVQTPDESTPPMFYRPLAQRSAYTRLYVVARTAGDPAGAVGMMRQELRSMDSNVPVYQAGTMDEHISAALALPRTAAGMLGLLGGLALLLASMGLYAVVAFAVSRRTTEIGIRMALGASGSRVIATVAKDTLVVVAAGVVLGLVLSFMAAPVLESFLFNVPTTDPATFVMVAVFMALVAAIAAYLPARRAARTDPMTALRFE